MTVLSKKVRARHLSWCEIKVRAEKRAATGSVADPEVKHQQNGEGLYAVEGSSKQMSSQR